MTPNEQKALELLKLNKISLHSFQIFKVLSQYAPPGETFSLSYSQIQRHLKYAAGTIFRCLQELATQHDEIEGKALIQLTYPKAHVHHGTLPKITITKFS